MKNYVEPCIFQPILNFMPQPYSKEEEKQTNTNPPTVKRGRGRPRKNLRERNESTQKHQMHDMPNRQTRNQTTQTRNPPRQPKRPRSRSNRRNQTNNFYNNLPPWRGRLRSLSNSSQDHPHFCPCPKCDPFRLERKHPADGTGHRATYPTLYLPRHLTIGRRNPCFPYNKSTEQFCIHHPTCIHDTMQRLRRSSHRPIDEQENPSQRRYNLRPRH